MPDQSRPRLSTRRKVGGDADPEVFVADEQSDITLDVDRWHQLAIAVLAAEGVRGGTELSVLFVGEAAMTELNESYMGKPGPTDVLAFPIDADEIEVVSGPSSMSRGPDRAPIDPGDLPLLLGDVVICPIVAERQSPTHAGTLDDEVALLLVHGILHVLGHDHAEDDEALRMRTRELELLESLHWHGRAPAEFRQEHSE